MKKLNVTKVIMLALIGATAVGCQKDSFQDIDKPIVSEEISQSYNMQYVIDGQTFSVTLYGNDEYRAFLFRMIDLAEHGYRVIFYNNDSERTNINSSKETVIYKTKNKQDAYDWCDAMSNDGYIVVIEYDPVTGMYTCTAYR